MRDGEDADLVVNRSPSQSANSRCFERGDLLCLMLVHQHTEWDCCPNRTSEHKYVV